MRWEALIADLESQYDAAVRSADDDAAAELAEAEIGSVRLADRLLARLGEQVTLRLRSGADVHGRLLDAAPQWLLLAADERRTLVPADAVVLARPLGPAAPREGHVEQRLRITHALRALARQGAPVRLTCGVHAYTGWLTRVGADHVDLRTDARAAGGGPGDVVTIALSALETVSTA
ncbi:hypothetical protein ACFSBG_17110 [Georgenia yuyongxinii]|uniref:hypothetical protein n=1 Tax=Georgenia yuyongxinii TaxID=2589797 RepID=UPI0015D27C68|nr:hypothetical protein [Georgenia yuyongxinii]